MKVIVLGLGSIGMRHARNLKFLGIHEILGVDPSVERQERFSSEIGGGAYSELTSEVSHGAQLVVIASPNRFHIEQAQGCVELGIHLFIEKPLGISNDNIDHLIKMVREKEIYAHIGSNWKFHPAFIRMKELLDQNVIGTVVGAQVLAGQWLPDWHPWEDYRLGYSARADLGGGIVLDMHELDYMSWLFGDITSLSGFINHSGCLEIETEDVACACLRFESGMLATLQVDYIQRSYQRRYHIYGSDGTIIWDIRNNQLSVYTAADQEETIENVFEDINEMYIRQMQHVLDGVHGDVPPVTPIEHARKILKLQLRLKENG